MKNEKITKIKFPPLPPFPTWEDIKYSSEHVRNGNPPYQILTPEEYLESKKEPLKERIKRIEQEEKSQKEGKLLVVLTIVVIIFVFFLFAINIE